MQTRSLGFLFSALASVSACEGCNDRRLPAAIPNDAAARYAAAICAAEQQCGCQLYASRHDCELDIAAAFEQATAAAASFDEACFESILVNPDLQGCVDTDGAELGCVAIVGSASAGEPCDRDPRLYFAMSGGTCGAGMICDLATSRCTQDPPGWPDKQPGDPCVKHHLASCGLDLYCETNGTCQPRTLEGDPCDEPHECEVGAYCAYAAGACTPRHELGEACDPADMNPCKYVVISTSVETTWCSPQTSICDANNPLVCTMLDRPLPP